MTELFYAVFSTAFFVTVLRTSTPLIFATMGGLISDLSGALNVALEGMMLMGALTGVIVSVYAPWYVAVASAVLVGSLAGGVIAFFHLRLKADIILVGFAINILAAGGTVFALAIATGGDKGTSTNLVSKAIPSVDLSFLSAIPGIGTTLTGFLSGHSVLTWMADIHRFCDLVLLVPHATRPMAARCRRICISTGSRRYPDQQSPYLEPDRLGWPGRLGRRAIVNVQLYRLHP